jgi:DNA-binding CsgD family transcriptional regulator
MCTSPDPVDSKINLAPDCSAIDALPVLTQEDLWIFLLHIAATCCTARQAECIRLHFGSGLTQREIANEIGLNQSTVAHSLYGIKLTSNREQDAKNQGKYYGGAIRSIRKQLLDKSKQEQLQALLTRAGTLVERPGPKAGPPRS